MRGLTFIPVVAVALALAACTPESVRSLPENTRIAVDERLVGTWRAEVLGNEHVAVVTPGAPGVLDVTLRTVSLAGKKAGMAPRESRHELRFHDLAGTPVIAEKGPGLIDGEAVYRFARVRFDEGGALTLLYTAELPIMKFVAPLKVLGELRSQDGVFHDIIVRASSDEVAAMMRNYTADELFGMPFGPFKRQ